MELSRKLALLADAAKYDASCASSGAAGRQSSMQHRRKPTSMAVAAVRCGNERRKVSTARARRAPH